MVRFPTPARAFLASAMAIVLANAGCYNIFPHPSDGEVFPLEQHPLLPEGDRASTQIAAGAVTGEAPVQPIAFPHNRHVQIDGIDCQYCHSAARNSIHAGVPEVQTCMGCHRYVLKDSPEIKLLTSYWERGEPVPWKKVHDLPDFVNFSHMRHVRAGVDCTECHGQVQTMAGVRTPVLHKAEGGEHGDVAATAAEAINPTTWEEAAEAYGPATGTMTRESTLEMGWCLDCHETHPSIHDNYNPDNTTPDAENLRRAELKDCWTCHK